MDPDIKKEWLEDLRSGTIKQGKGALENSEGEQCCMGVLCNIAVRHGVITKRIHYCSTHIIFGVGGSDIHTGTLPAAVIKWAGLSMNRAADNPIVENKHLSHYNDALGYSFEQIADLIERGL